MSQVTVKFSGIALLALVAASCGIGGAFGPPSALSPEQILTLTDNQLCHGYGGRMLYFGVRGYTGMQAIEVKAEISRRGLVHENSWSAIDRNRVTIGMTPCAARAAWGAPRDINRTTTAYGVREQWVFRASSYDSNYLYFQDGLVTSIQD